MLVLFGGDILNGSPTHDSPADFYGYGYHCGNVDIHHSSYVRWQRSENYRVVNNLFCRTLESYIFARF